MTTYFIAGAIERPGRVHNYVVKSFGKKALTDRGTIKPEYLDKALAKR